MQFSPPIQEEEGTIKMRTEEDGERGGKSGVRREKLPLPSHCGGLSWRRWSRRSKFIIAICCTKTRSKVIPHPPAVSYSTVLAKQTFLFFRCGTEYCAEIVKGATTIIIFFFSGRKLQIVLLIPGRPRRRKEGHKYDRFLWRSKRRYKQRHQEKMVEDPSGIYSKGGEGRRGEAGKKEMWRGIGLLPFLPFLLSAVPADHAAILPLAAN